MASCGECWEDHDENDPCYQKHLELAEKSKTLMEKLKRQSDLILTARRDRLRLFQRSEMVVGPEQTDAVPEPQVETSPDDVTLTINPGEMFVAMASVAMWVNPYGAAAVGTGFYFPANQLASFEYDPDPASGGRAAASVSAIDV